MLPGHLCLLPSCQMLPKLLDGSCPALGKIFMNASLNLHFLYSFYWQSPWHHPASFFGNCIFSWDLEICHSFVLSLLSFLIYLLTAIKCALPSSPLSLREFNSLVVFPLFLLHILFLLPLIHGWICSYICQVNANEFQTFPSSSDKSSVSELNCLLVSLTWVTVWLKPCSDSSHWSCSSLFLITANFAAWKPWPLSMGVQFCPEEMLLLNLV